MQRSLALAIIATAFAQNVWTSWHRWGDLIIDCGRELDVPRQLLAGKTLYQQVRYWYGPLAPYGNALLYRLFGVHSDVIAVTGWTTAALVAWLAYRTVRLFAGRGAAVAGTVAVLYLNAFAFYYGYNIFNFVLPYSCPATYGTMLALASVYCLLRYVRKQRRIDFLLACLLLSLIGLCKLEVFFATAVTHLVFATCAVATHRLKMSWCLAGYAGAMAIPAGVYAWFYARTGPELWSENLFVSGNLASDWFTISRTGMVFIAEFGKDAFWSAHGLAGCLAVMWVLARAEDWLKRDNRPRGGLRRAGILVLGLLGGALCMSVHLRLGPFLALRVLPLLLLVLIVTRGVRFFRSPRAVTARRELAALLMDTFAFVLLGRIVLRCGADYYGFYMALPGVLVLAIFWCKMAPALMSPRKLGRSTAAQMCGFLIMAGLLWTHAERTSRKFDETYDRGRTELIRAPGGVMPCSIAYAGTVDRAIEYLSAMPPQITIVVVPEGAGITFLSGHANPLGLHTFLPGDFSGSYDDEGMVKRFEQAAPDVIVRTARDVREWGGQGLGIDYGRKLSAWIDAHYREVKAFGSGFYKVGILVRSP